MAYWLMKTEPTTFGIDHLRARKTEPWDGVRNFQARNNMQAMRKGDLAFFYHSNVEPKGIVGVCKIVREAYPDHTQFDPGSKYFEPKASPEKPVWFMVKVGFVQRFPRMVTLEELKSTPGLEDMVVARRGSRLSVQPISEKEWEIVTHLAHA